MKKLSAICLILLIFSFSNSFAQNDPGRNAPAVIAEKEASPAAVHSLLAELLGNLEALRLEMGKPDIGYIKLNITGAEPRDVYYLARSLYKKINKLYFEWTRDEEPELPFTEGNVTTSDLMDVLSRANNLTKKVMDATGVSPVNSPHPLNLEINMDNIFQDALIAGRISNHLLTGRISPNSPYQEISASMKIASDILSRYPGVERLPQPDPLIRQKTPEDVYKSLIGNYGKLCVALDAAGIKSPRIEIAADSKAVIEPGDVYTIAHYIRWQLYHMRTKLFGPSKVDLIYYSGSRLPAHVFQRASILRKQIENLNTVAGQIKSSSSGAANQ